MLPTGANIIKGTKVSDCFSIILRVLSKYLILIAKLYKKLKLFSVLQPAKK
jgi:hypothetical protein